MENKIISYSLSLDSDTQKACPRLHYHHIFAHEVTSVREHNSASTNASFWYRQRVVSEAAMHFPVEWRLAKIGRISKNEDVKSQFLNFKEFWRKHILPVFKISFWWLKILSSCCGSPISPLFGVEAITLVDGGDDASVALGPAAAVASPARLANKAWRSSFSPPSPDLVIITSCL